MAYFDERKGAGRAITEKLRSDPDIYLIQVPLLGRHAHRLTNAYPHRHRRGATCWSIPASAMRRRNEVLRSALQDLPALTWRAPTCSPHTSTSTIWA